MKYLPNYIIVPEENTTEKAFYTCMVELIEILNHPDKPDINERSITLMQDMDGLLETMQDSDFKDFVLQKYATLKEAKNLNG